MGRTVGTDFKRPEGDSGNALLRLYDNTAKGSHMFCLVDPYGSRPDECLLRGPNRSGYSSSYLGMDSQGRLGYGGEGLIPFVLIPVKGSKGEYLIRPRFFEREILEGSDYCLGYNKDTVGVGLIPRSDNPRFLTSWKLVPAS